MARAAITLAIVAQLSSIGCGRLGVDPAPAADAADESLADARVPEFSCVDTDLASFIGTIDVASPTGTNAYTGECDLGGPETAYAWTAPATDEFEIETCTDTASFNVALHSDCGDRFGQCVSGVSACASVTRSATVGQRFVIVVEGAFTLGEIQLSIRVAPP